MNLFSILADTTDFCTSNAGKKIFGFTGQIFDIIMIVIPIILIVMGSIDFIKAVIAQKPDEMKKAQSTFIKRIIVGVVVFFVPAIITFLMGLIGQETKNPCMICFNNPKDPSCQVTENNSGTGNSTNQTPETNPNNKEETVSGTGSI